MTDKELLEIEARANAATPGPWVDNITSVDQHFTLQPTKAVVGLEDCGSPYNPWQRMVLDEADRQFIAHAREDIPRLVNEVRRLRALTAAIIEAHDGRWLSRDDTSIEKARAYLGFPPAK